MDSHPSSFLLQSLSLSVVVSLDAVLFEKFSKLGAEEEYRSSELVVL
jgi:hypothetical protein